MLRAILSVLVLVLSACVTPQGPGQTRVNELHGEPIQGLRAAEPDYPGGGDKYRLDIFLGIPRPAPAEGEAPLEPLPGWADVVYCVAINPDKEPLPEVALLISATPADKVIYLWGSPISIKHGFWWAGVDCMAHAIAVWHPKAQDYVYFDLDYSIPFYKRFEIRELLKKAVKKGAETARELAPL